MAIQGIKQPDLIQIDNSLRLRKFDGVYDFALEWYQDVEMVWLVDGDRVPYTPELLTRMYTWLNDSGELYFIEVLENGVYIPIGDVTFWQEDMPIVIGDPRYRGQGIGTRVVAALIERGRGLGYDHLEVEDIYDWNEASRRCFEKLGFRAVEKTAKGNRYRLDIPAVTIREAGPEDAPVLDGLLTELIRYEHRYDGNLDPRYTVTDNYAGMIGRNGCKIWIAEADGAACGFLCALVYDFPVYVRPVVILDALYVREGHRKKGYASALMAELKRYAASVNACAIELKVYSANEAACRLYAGHGFTEAKKYMRLELLP